MGVSDSVFKRVDFLTLSLRNQAESSLLNSIRIYSSPLFSIVRTAHVVEAFLHRRHQTGIQGHTPGMEDRDLISKQKLLQQQSPRRLHLDEDGQGPATLMASQDRQVGLPLMPLWPSHSLRRAHHFPLPNVGHAKTKPHRRKENLGRTGRTHLHPDRPGQGRHHRGRGRMVRSHLRLPSLSRNFTLVITFTQTHISFSLLFFSNCHVITHVRTVRFAMLALLNLLTLLSHRLYLNESIPTWRWLAISPLWGRMRVMSM